MAQSYVSKEEKKIPISDPSGKWSDMTLLPEWEEEFYNVYTARKHGKWVMLKALKERYRNDAKCREMLDREFDTRYNLAHPNIVMVNDLEEVPGIGLAIITDDVYGYSLRRMIDEKRLTPRILNRLQTQLIDAMEYIQENHLVHYPITAENIIFTEYNENLKLINVGYDQASHLTHQDTEEDLRSYGLVLGEVLDHLPAKMPRLRRIANKAAEGGYNTVTDLQLAVEKRSSAQLYLFLIATIAVAVVLMLAFAYFFK